MELKINFIKSYCGYFTRQQGNNCYHGKVHAILSLGVGLQEDLTGRENIYLEAGFAGEI